MFEIYREGGYNRRYRVVYFTELDDHNRDHEIDRGVAGDNFLDGSLAEPPEEAKQSSPDAGAPERGGPARAGGPRGRLARLA